MGADDEATSLQGVTPNFRPHQTRYFRKHATSVPAELGGKIHNVSRNRTRTQVLPQAQKSHVYGSRAFGAFGELLSRSLEGRPVQVLGLDIVARGRLRQ